MSYSLVPFTRDEDSWDKALETLEHFSTAQVLALLNYLSNDTALRLRRESLLQQVYKRCEAMVVAVLATVGTPRAYGSGALLISDGTAQKQMRSRLGITKAIAFETSPLPLPGTAFTLSRWLESVKKIPITATCSEDRIAFTTRQVASQMSGAFSTEAPLYSELLAEARLLIHSANATAQEIEVESSQVLKSDLMSTTRTMALSSCVATGRDSAPMDEAGQQQLLKMIVETLYASSPEATAADQVKGWAFETASAETTLGLYVADLWTDKPELLKGIGVSTKEFWKLSAPEAVELLQIMGREVAMHAYLINLAQELGDQFVIDEANQDLETMFAIIDKTTTGTSLKAERSMSLNEFGLN